MELSESHELIGSFFAIYSVRFPKRFTEEKKSFF